MAGLQVNEAASELQQPLIDVLPVEPRDLVVLAVRVVVAALGAADLVAAEQHRNPLREKQGREDVALLAGTESVHRRITCGPFRAAVPGSVVALAVVTTLEIRLVVLLVVRDQIAKREAIV